MSSADVTENAMAIHPQASFDAPRVNRVHEVEDETLASLMKWLLSLRRMKNAVALSAFGFGAFLCGFIETDRLLYTALIYATMGGVTLMPALAIGSLGVRRLFLKEARAMGLSRSTALLLLTRAERRARTLSPFVSGEEKLKALGEAVRQWDEA
jgi:hypothetical protein